MTKMVAGISKAAVEREAAMMEASSNFIWAKKLRALRAALDKAEAERDQLLKPLETLQAQNFRLSGMVHDLRKEIADTDILLIREATESLARLDRAEKAEAERDRLGRELNVAKYGQPDFAWSVHLAAMAEVQAERDRLRAALEDIVDHDTGATAGLAYTAKIALKGATP